MFYQFLLNKPNNHPIKTVGILKIWKKPIEKAILIIIIITIINNQLAI